MHTGKKRNCKKQQVEALANWLQGMKADNDDLEKERDNLLKTHGVTDEADLTAQSQVQEEQQQQQPPQQQGPQQPTPELDFSQYPPPTFDAAPLLANPYFHRNNPSQGTILHPPQQATPSPPQPPQPYQGYQYPMSDAEIVAERMFNQGLQTFYGQRQPYPQQPPPAGWAMSQLSHTLASGV